MYLLTKEEGGRPKPLTEHFQAIVYMKTANMAARVSLAAGKEMAMPGEDTEIEFRIFKKMVIKSL